MNDRVLALADVAVSLGGRPVLRDIDLTVTQGEVVAPVSYTHLTLPTICSV